MVSWIENSVKVSKFPNKNISHKIFLDITNDPNFSLKRDEAFLI